MATSACRTFPNNTDYVTKASFLDPSTTAFTCSCWFKTPSASNTQIAVGCNLTNNYLELRSSKTGAVANNTVYAATSTISANAWQFCCTSIAGASPNDLELYYSTSAGTVANETSTGSVSYSTTSAQEISAGVVRVGTTTADFEGQLAYIIFHTQELTLAQIQECKENPFCAIFDNIEICWPMYFDSSTEYDLSGNGNNGTVSGAATDTDGPPIGLYAAMAQ